MAARVGKPAVGERHLIEIARKAKVHTNTIRFLRVEYQIRARREGTRLMVSADDAARLENLAREFRRKEAKINGRDGGNRRERRADSRL